MLTHLTNLASTFVQRNPNQSQRKLRATTATKEPIVHLHQHPLSTSAEQHGGNAGYGHDTDTDESLAAVLTDIAANASQRQEVLLLGRYKHLKPRDLSKLQMAYPNFELAFSTVHAAKGLEADVIVVLDVSAGRCGFPRGVSDDPILSLVLADADPFPYAEERRLFMWR